MRIAVAMLAGFGLVSVAVGAEPTSAPRQIPLTRPEMKQYLEDMKQRTPRIPLPELTDAEKEQAGDRSRGYESRLRTHYLPRGNDRFSFNGGGANRTAARLPLARYHWHAPTCAPEGTRPDGARPEGGRGGGRDNEPGMTLDYRFKVSLFWIVSRTNNCQYCLGHQESKLLSAGMTGRRDRRASTATGRSSTPPNRPPSPSPASSRSSPTN